MKSSRQIKREKHKEQLIQETSYLYEEVSKKNTPDHLDELDALHFAQKFIDITAVTKAVIHLKIIFNRKRRMTNRAKYNKTKYMSVINDNHKNLKQNGFYSVGLMKVQREEKTASLNEILNLKPIKK